MKGARWLVFGKTGQVAQGLAALAPQAIFVGRDQCELTDKGFVRAVLDQYSPRVVINAAAYTDVDKVETDSENAMRVNAEAPAEMARWCAVNGSSLVHYSTDYVYKGDGERPWREDDALEPLNQYGVSKLAGELAIRESGCHHIILRTSWIFSPVGKNFVKTMLRLGMERENLRIVCDQIGSPTYAPDIARATLQIVSHPKFRDSEGIFNLVNSGTTSWFDFANQIFASARAVGIPLKVQRVERIPSQEYPLPARRPLNSRMSTEKINTQFDIQLRSWDSALADCLAQLAR